MYYFTDMDYKFRYLEDVLDNFLNGINSDKFPQYSLIILKELKNDNSVYGRIEMALAGYKKEDIKINSYDNVLIITGTYSGNKIDNNKEKVHGNIIARRNFIRQFKLNENVEVGNITFENGLLVIQLKLNIPEANKPKTYQIE